ncbi:phage head morphogenesis protein [Yersinia ruckeri]|nr:phage head morphogenesis protein [Yersinia ruckeri]OJC86754.1 phage head morphogenesis protein [Yersinia ruckeri]UIN15718.1 phage head morphogenesis protein [Yersinia ruckeri]UIN19083.1 phage head morphogenesis protein [Yersinia ruckeri]
MNDDVKRQVLEIILANPLAEDSKLAMDANPVQLVKRALDALARKWVDRFINKALPVSDVLFKKTENAVDRGLLAAARKEAITINMQWTPAMTEKVDAIIAENVSLIRSIPEKYFTEVEGMVYRAVSRGGDRKGLADEIEANFGKRHGITRRRAEFIARDQVRKATSALSSARQQAAGITKGIWLHSGGGSEPRKKHVHANGREFDLDKGLPIGDKGQYVLPGEEPNCGCTWKPVLPF